MKKVTLRKRRKRRVLIICERMPITSYNDINSVWTVIFFSFFALAYMLLGRSKNFLVFGSAYFLREVREGLRDGVYGE